MTVTVRGTTIDYTQPFGGGIATIRVVLATSTPRVCTFLTNRDHTISPISFFIDEILTCIEDAKKRVPQVN